MTAPPTADATGDTVVDARGGGKIHNSGQHTVAEGDKGRGPDEGKGPGVPGDDTQQPLLAAAPPEAESENYTPQSWMAVKLAQGGPLLQVLTPADRTLISLYGDTTRHNDGMHLNGGIDGVADRLGQRLHRCIASCNLALYNLLSGHWAARF